MNEFEKRYWWHVGRRIILSGLLKKYAPFSQKNLFIADVGCGTGGNFEILEKFGNVVGADKSEDALEYCREKNKAVRQTNGNALPFSDGRIDLVSVFDVLEHIENEDEMIGECYRILKKGGRLILTVPAYEFMWSRHDDAMGHYRRYDKKRILEKFKKAGFSVVRISHFITFMFPIIFMIRIAGKIILSKKSSRKTYTPIISPLNELLTEILRAESFLLERINLPFGSSIAAIFEKK